MLVWMGVIVPSRRFVVRCLSTQSPNPKPRPKPKATGAAKDGRWTEFAGETRARVIPRSLGV